MSPRLNIEVRWVPVESNSGTAYRFPVHVTERMRAIYDKPAVYRWLVTSPNAELKGVYFGETESLACRVAQYISPGKSQQTNIRLKSYFDERLKEKCTIAVEMLEFDPFSIKDIEIDAKSMRHSFVRKFLESFAFMEFQCTSANKECDLLNRSQDASQKVQNRKVREIGKILKAMPAQEGEEILKRLRS